MLLRRKWASLFAAMMVASLLFAACTVPVTPLAEGVATEAIEDEVAPEAPEEEEVKELVWASGTAVKTMDPYRGRSTDERSTHMLIFDSLLDLDYEKNEVVPNLAESWEVSEDGLTWTFYLKEGVKFSDGTDFNAEAAKYALEKFADPEFGHSFHSQFALIKDVEVLDDYTVQFSTDGPFTPVLINLSHPSAAMVSPTAYEEHGEDFTLHPVGTGPYQLKSWEGDTVIVERNPYYEGDLPWADEIKYVTAPEAGARMALLESGDVDIIAKVLPQEVERLRESGIKIEVQPSLYMVSFEANVLKPPLDDVRVRHAIMYAIDHEAIAQDVLQGMAEVPVSVVGFGIPHVKELDPWPYDPEKAKQLLAEAGYPDGFDINLWSPNGRYLRDAEVAEAVQAMLAEVGINADFQTFEWSSYLDAVNNPGSPDSPKDLFMLGRSSPGLDFHMYRLWHSASPSRTTGYTNPRVDELLDQARTTLDPQELSEIYGEAQEIVFTEEVPFIFLYNQKQIWGMQSDTYADIAPTEYIILRNTYKE